MEGKVLFLHPLYFPALTLIYITVATTHAVTLRQRSLHALLPRLLPRQHLRHPPSKKRRKTTAALALFALMPLMNAVFLTEGKLF